MLISAAAQPEDDATPEYALARAAEHGYLVPDARRTAFVQGFLHALGHDRTENERNGAADAMWSK